ncbi:MAG: citrate lyase holo-[Bacteroidales bacterium]|nr:citrate lyase holo-[acyl-carrier protein] synthase [Bacteroidales bacterium]
MAPQPITLDQLLASRDERHAIQLEIIQSHPHHTLICLTVVMPGSIKRNKQSLTVATSAVEALKEAFHPNPDQLIERDLPTGYEAFLITEVGCLEAKRKTCEIEDTHPLGRLFDIDVLDAEGIPISRQSINHNPRKCLLCDNEARFCMRNHTHTQDELWQYINQIIDQYDVH